MAALSDTDPEVIYKIFCTTPQEPQRLSAALRGFFDENVPASHREAYGLYLQKRIRPVVVSLMADEEVDKLEVIERLGWLGNDCLDGLIQTARAQNRTASLVWLLQLKARRGQYHERDFQL